MSLFYRDVKTHQGSAALTTLEQLKPEEHFEPFKPFTGSCEELNSDQSDCQSKCNSTKLIDSLNQITSSLLTPSKSTLLSSPSSDKVAEQDIVSKETPKVLGGFRGGLGCSGSKPSPASRLSVIDKKWLERCQVFGEMEADVRPGAGNQEALVKGRDNGEIQANAQDCGADDAAMNKKEDSSEHIEKEHSSEHIEKGRNTQSENGREISEAHATTSPLAGGEESQNHKPKSVKKVGRKRQREEENVKGSPAMEGVVKKRRRNAKCKGETTDGEPGASPVERKKRKAKDTDDDNSKKDTCGDNKVPKMVSYFIRK